MSCRTFIDPDTIVMSNSADNQSDGIRDSDSNLKGIVDIVIIFLISVSSVASIPIVTFIYVWMFATGPEYRGIYTFLSSIVPKITDMIQREYFTVYDFFDTVYDTYCHQYRWGKFTRKGLKESGLLQMSKLVMITDSEGGDHNIIKGLEKALFEKEINLDGSFLKYISERDVVPLTGNIKEVFETLKCSTIHDTDDRIGISKLLIEIVSIIDTVDKKDRDEKISDILQYIDFIHTYKMARA